MSQATSTILDSEYIEREIRGTGMLLHYASRAMFEDELISEADYLALQVIADKLIEDIAPRTAKLIEASYELLKKEQQ
ncbi:hypothetical protein JCM11957_07040 [Caminibacter profundus]